jgi:hypothetical protein
MGVDSCVARSWPITHCRQGQSTTRHYAGYSSLPPGPASPAHPNHSSSSSSSRYHQHEGHAQKKPASQKVNWIQQKVHHHHQPIRPKAKQSSYDHAADLNCVCQRFHPIGVRWYSSIRTITKIPSFRRKKKKRKKNKLLLLPVNPHKIRCPSQFSQRRGNHPDENADEPVAIIEESRCDLSLVFVSPTICLAKARNESNHVIGGEEGHENAEKKKQARIRRYNRGVCKGPPPGRRPRCSFSLHRSQQPQIELWLAVFSGSLEVSNPRRPVQGMYDVAKSLFACLRLSIIKTKVGIDRVNIPEKNRFNFPWRLVVGR